MWAQRKTSLTAHEKISFMKFMWRFIPTFTGIKTIRCFSFNFQTRLVPKVEGVRRSAFIAQQFPTSTRWYEVEEWDI